MEEPLAALLALHGTARRWRLAAPGWQRPARRIARAADHVSAKSDGALSLASLLHNAADRVGDEYFWSLAGTFTVTQWRDPAASARHCGSDRAAGRLIISIF